MKICIPVLLFLLNGCANILNLHTAAEYFEGGKILATQEKWSDARLAFGRAWANADLGREDDYVTTVYAYEYGRASGVICDWKEAEVGLQKSLELDRKTSGPVHMPLTELARMYHAKGDLEESVKYFAQAKTELDKVEADTRDAIAYANILKEYAEVLAKLQRNKEAALLIHRENEIKNVFKGRKSSHEQTPYGKHCSKPSQQIQ